jgi:hypothetical protein
MAMLTKYPVVSVSVAAERVGVTEGRIRQLLGQGSIDGQHTDPNNEDSPWLVDIASLDRWAKKPQTVGRPRISSKAS